MNPHVKSGIAFILLLFLISVSFWYTKTTADPVAFCEGNTSCLSRVATELHQPNLCSDAINQTDCHILATHKTGDPFFCNSNKECLLSYATAFDEPELCESLNMSDSCYFQTAYANEQPIYCEQSSQTGRCYYSLALAWKEKAYCEKSGKFNATCNQKLINQD